MASTASNSFLQTAIQFIQEGGTFMYPIILVGLIGIAIIIERALYLHAVKRRNQAFWQQLYPSVSQYKFKQALTDAENNKAALALMVENGLQTARYSRSPEDMELAMEESLMEIMPRLETRTGYVATFANIATLLGLLGTIIGLITAFSAVASADPAQKAELLSASISVAMNTTALGLLVAIPLLLAHAFITSMTNKVVDSLEIASMKCLNFYRAFLTQAESNKNSAA